MAIQRSISGKGHTIGLWPPLFLVAPPADGGSDQGMACYMALDAGIARVNVAVRSE